MSDFGKMSAELSACTVHTLDGADVEFASLLGEKSTLILFVRHFGCIFCRSRLAGLQQYQSELEASDIKAVVVGNGTVPMARAFVEEIGWELPLFTDPTGEAHKLAGMQRRFGLGPRAVLQAVRAYTSGQRQGQTAGDVWQQGGWLLIDAQGMIKHRHADTGAGDSIDFSQVLRRARTA